MLSFFELNSNLPELIITCSPVNFGGASGEESYDL